MSYLSIRTRKLSSARLRNVLRSLASVVVLSAVVLGGCSAGRALNAVTGGSPGAVTRGISYGDHPRHTYDLYEPENGAAPSSVIAFFYGGAWQRGSRDAYAFVGSALARQGLTVAVIDYRVYPDVVFPGFIEDGARALAHLQKTVAADRPLIVAGHSAGAHIGALVAFDDRYLAAFGMSRCQSVDGFVGIAGPYDFLPLQRDDIKAVFPVALREQSQPVNFVSRASPPSLLVHGRDDTTVLPRNSERLAQRLRKHNVAVLEHVIDGGHVKPLLALTAPFAGSSKLAERIGAFATSPEVAAANVCESDS